MTNWITRPGRIDSIEYTLDFDGYSFPCDQAGTVDRSSLASAGRASYDLCISASSGQLQMADRSLWETGSIRCRCGAQHYLARGDSACDNCGQDYNASGQELLPSHMWEEG